MSHPLVLALFPNAATAAAGARALHGLGISRDRISVVAGTHDEEGALAEQMDATPGSDIEDSRTAGRLGELSGFVLAAAAIVMPGIGPIVTAGPLAAGLGEAAGHLAGSVAGVLTDASVPQERAEAIEREIARGAVLIAVHTTSSEAAAVRDVLATGGATQVDLANWNEPA